MLTSSDRGAFCPASGERAIASSGDASIIRDGAASRVRRRVAGYPLRVEWARLVEQVARVRATSKRTEKVALIAELLRQAQGRDIELVAL